jgi:serine phosphatase RsbU (regulator of sigma subunit)
MQGEIREKTEAIQQDLAVARQFQEALLPASYPEVPAPGSPDPLRLMFRHVYTPALSVGGDFFDVSRLGDHRARILIADVMGHGARSALVTAILHTMLGSGGVDEDPGQVLTWINRQFCGLVSKTRTTMFLTACHLVADTREGTLRFAVAGHPSPLVVRRSGGVAENLVTSENRFPAIGLFESTEYRSASRPLSAGEIYLLYTDGLVEAADSRGEEFGEGRLRTTAAEAVRRGAGSLPEALRESVNGFLGATMPDDDICMLSVEVLACGGPAPRSR